MVIHGGHVHRINPRAITILGLDQRAHYVITEFRDDYSPARSPLAWESLTASTTTAIRSRPATKLLTETPTM